MLTHTPHEVPCQPIVAELFLYLQIDAILRRRGTSVDREVST